MPLSRRRLSCASLALVASLLAPAAPAQTLAATSTTADSVVARLVAWRARSDQPVTLSALTAFEWDSFSVVRAPAGVAMANCGREGFLPCGPDLQPPPDAMVQVLRFDHAGQSVYEERIMAPSGRFAEPLPQGVPRARATLVSCAGNGDAHAGAGSRERRRGWYGGAYGGAQGGGQGGPQGGTAAGPLWCLDGGPKPRAPQRFLDGG
ncbi:MULTISPECIES: hypothetical protein [unclassified Cupriavidus]|uniref:hypothetical protein n=1 Tax=Cupriavidus sp. H19C3 TaxID=3241603 RepID=UPI003BF8994B